MIGRAKIDVDCSEMERVLSDYVIAGISRELGEYAGEGKLPDSSRLWGISVDLQFCEGIMREMEGSGHDRDKSAEVSR